MAKWLWFLRKGEKVLKCKENLIYSINKGMIDLAAAKARLNSGKFRNFHFKPKLPFLRENHLNDN